MLHAIMSIDTNQMPTGKSYISSVRCVMWMSQMIDYNNQTYMLLPSCLVSCSHMTNPVNASSERIQDAK